MHSFTSRKASLQDGKTAQQGSVISPPVMPPSGLTLHQKQTMSKPRRARVLLGQHHRPLTLCSRQRCKSAPKSTQQRNQTTAAQRPDTRKLIQRLGSKGGRNSQTKRVKPGTAAAPILGILLLGLTKGVLTRSTSSRSGIRSRLSNRWLELPFQGHQQPSPTSQQRQSSKPEAQRR